MFSVCCSSAVWFQESARFVFSATRNIPSCCRSDRRGGIHSRWQKCFSPCCVFFPLKSIRLNLNEVTAAILILYVATKTNRWLNKTSTHVPAPSAPRPLSPPPASSRFPTSITEALSKTITQQARIRRQVAAAHPRYRSVRLNWWSGCCREMAGVWEAAVMACRASCPLTTKTMGWSERSWQKLSSFFFLGLGPNRLIFFLKKKKLMHSLFWWPCTVPKLDECTDTSIGYRYRCRGWVFTIVKFSLIPWHGC